MEVINIDHDEIKRLKRAEQTAYIDFYKDTEIHFSAKAVRDCDIRIGNYIHFVNDEDYWYFYIDAEKDGFILMASCRRHCVAIYHSALVRLFMLRTRLSTGTKFEIYPTKNYSYGSRLYKINTHKPIEYIKIKINKNIVTNANA